MKILFVTGKFPPTPCGIGDHTFRLAIALQGLGHQPYVFTTALAEPALEMMGIPVFRKAAQWDFQTARQLLSCILENDISLVHLQYHATLFGPRPIIPRLPAWLKTSAGTRGIRIVVTMHELAGPAIPGLPRLLRLAWLFPMLRAADAVIATNERDERLLRRALTGNPRKLHRIPLAPNLDVAPASPLDRSRIRSRLGMNPKELLIVRFGFIHNFCGSLIPDLLKALKGARARGLQAKLLFVGAEEPAAGAALQQMARTLGLVSDIHRTGYGPPAEISAALQAADFAVQLYPEGASDRRSALLTVLAHGLPVISTEGKGLSPAFRHGENLLLVPTGNSRRLTEALLQMGDTPALRDRLRGKAASAAAPYTWEATARATQTVYQALCS